MFPTGIPQPLLDACDSSAYRNIAERMQGFFSSLYDNWLEQSSLIIDFYFLFLINRKIPDTNYSFLLYIYFFKFPRARECRSLHAARLLCNRRLGRADCWFCIYPSRQCSRPQAPPLSSYPLYNVFFFFF